MSHETVAGLLDGPALRWPRKAAVIDASSSASFEELHSAVMRFAEWLAFLDVGIGDRVAIVAGRSIDTVVSILGTIECGAAYVPLDPASPAERLRFLIDEVAPKAIIAPRGASGASWLTDVNIHLLVMEEVRRLAVPGARALCRPRPEDLAAIIYTSGSTGRPKGVELTHRNIAAFLTAHNRVMQVDHESVSLNTAPFHFDVSIMDTLLPLSVGASVHISPAPIPSVMLQLLEDRRVTHLCIVSSVLALMTGDGTALKQHDLSALKAILFGAEVCNVRVIRAWRDFYPDIRMINNYGPTETTVVCVTREINDLEVLESGYYPIGKPHVGMTALLCAEDGAAGEDTRTGTHGELLLSGPQLARGYWRRPEEQARAFVHVNGIDCYRTGDICSRDSNGDLHFVGRHDDEVKINGYRVHLNEVSRNLQSHPDVLNALVFAVKEPDGFSSLACAVVLRSAPSRESLAGLQRHLRSRIPGYMVPRHMVAVNELHQLPSGKADRRAIEKLWRERPAAGEPAFLRVVDNVLTEIV
jgi:D-alanine--poly(phosphoribitol) ligase subunit 1